MSRNIQLVLRVNQEEKDIIQEKANLNGMTVGSYLRSLGLYSNKIQLETKLKHLKNDE